MRSAEAAAAERRQTLTTKITKKAEISNFIPPKRLPVQHRQKPHCDRCGSPMPVDFMATGGDDMNGWTVESVSFHLRCKCGARFTAKRNVVG